MPHKHRGIHFEEIRPLHLAEYAKTRGWRRITTKRDTIIVYAHPQEGRYEQLIIPTHHDVADYTERMFDAITTLADHEKREMSEVYQDVLCTSWLGQDTQDG